MIETITRQEILLHLDNEISLAIPTYLKPIETIWQPDDLLPQSRHENFYDEIKQLQRSSEGISDDLMVVLIGDTITEEALPTYESWLSLIKMNKDHNRGWYNWVKAWTAEENRHGDTLGGYLYLCGRVNMREVQVSTQYLLKDGFDVGTARDPYKSFIYTSFQELATNISHRRVARLAKLQGDDLLAGICGHVSGDEARHAKAYKFFVSRILELDPSGLMIAFAAMMKQNITMPAHFLRESGQPKAAAFIPFADAAERTGVYTRMDYVAILIRLISEWRISAIGSLSEEAEKARDYIMGLPARFTRLAERSTVKAASHQFAWLHKR